MLISRRHTFQLIGLGAATTLLVVGCSSGTPAPPAPVVGGIVGFDQRTAVLNDSSQTGAIPTADEFMACGSSTSTFAAEIVTSGPTNAKVRYEWGQVVPGVQAMASGKVLGLTFVKNGDLPFTHSLGPDMTFGLLLDQPYARLAQVLGTGLGGNRPGMLHTELSQDTIPHGTDGNYLPGFTPENGDRIAVQGPWIVDCGHDDFHTEIHPATFTAIGRQEGSSTVSNAFYSPYAVSQLFTPDPSKVTDFADASRFTDPNTSAFPLYVYHLLAGLAGAGPEAFQGNDRLESHVLIDATPHIPETTWYVCAPGSKPSGGTLSVSADFTTRSGVKITVTPNDDIGCAQAEVSIGSNYAPASIVRNDCTLSWQILNQQAQAALLLPGLDVQKAIDALVPASIVDEVNKDPIVDCFDPLEVPQITSGQGIKVSDAQPYPFYGQVKVSWKS